MREEYRPSKKWRAKKEIYPLTTGSKGVVTLSSIAMGGDAIGRKDNFVIFVPYGVPEDKIQFEVISYKKRFARCKITKIIRASPYRIEPRCNKFFNCGGCHLQHIKYSAQLAFKKNIVRDAMFRIGRLGDVNIRDPLGLGEPWFYRNKVQAVAQYDRCSLNGAKREPILGLYARKSHDVVRIDDCVIQNPLNNRVLIKTLEVIKRLKWEIYDESTHTGWLRHVVSRTSDSRKEALLILVSRVPELPDIDRFIDYLNMEVPEIKGVVLNHNPDITNVIMGRSCKSLWGWEHLYEEINKIVYRISSLSFFQINRAGLEILIKMIMQYGKFRGHEVVLDAFCGVGVFTLAVARHVKKVYGVENEPAAIDDARFNAITNDCRNVVFKEGRVEDVIEDFARERIKFELILCDPPRSGVSRKLFEWLSNIEVPRIIYISCNPATLARDLAILKNLKYEIVEVQPVDMFPHTCQIEVMAYMERRRL